MHLLFPYPSRPGPPCSQRLLAWEPNLTLPRRRGDGLVPEIVPRTVGPWGRGRPRSVSLFRWWRWQNACLISCLAAALVAAAGCGKDTAREASDSDANGYLCAKCGAKLYTDRSVFIGPKCPKCKQDGLVEVVGYYCAKDQYLTLTGRGNDRGGATACEKCGAPLGGMRLPRQKDLQAWGASRAPK